MLLFPLLLFQIPQRYRFSSKSQPDIIRLRPYVRCFRYHKGTDFQANHNCFSSYSKSFSLFQIPQRYRFSSKSQRISDSKGNQVSCFRYHKGTDFQANHNIILQILIYNCVVLDTTKVQIFKQITTQCRKVDTICMLFQIPQRYRFSSKSQR